MKTYSIYEAKAKFSELVRAAVATGRVVVTQNGVPVVSVIPYLSEKESLEERLASLVKADRATPATASWPSSLSDLPPSKKRAGGVNRFLDERD